MKKRNLIIIMLIAISLTAVTGSISFADNANTAKNETVYVILDSSGKVVDERVVNWIHGTQSHDSFSDFGNYISVKNLKSEYTPEINNDEIIWNGSILKDGDIFYEGITDKELPIDISIDYYLDGKKTEASHLAGKSGKLKLVINLKNKLKIREPIQYKNHKNIYVQKSEDNYVPLMVQMSYSADLGIFSDIKAENAGKIVVGESMTLSLMSFPYPDAEFVVEMTGKDIELAPISFTILPQMPPITDLDSLDQIAELYNGVSKIGDGIEEISTGSNRLIDGGKELQKGGKQMMSGVSNLFDALNKLEKSSGSIASGIDSSIQGLNQLVDGSRGLSSGAGEMKHGLDSLINASESFGSGIGSLAEGVDSIASAGSQVALGLENLQTSHGQLLKAAEMLMESNPEGSDLYNLGLAIVSEDKMIEAIAAGGASLNNGLKELQTASSSLKSSWNKQFMPGLQQVGSAASELYNGSHSLTEGLEEYSGGQEQLKSGINAYLDGSKKLTGGMRTMNKNTDKLFAGFDELITSQIKINEGIKTISSTAIPEMKNALSKAVDDINFGTAKKDVMKELAHEYTSFMDSKRNKNSSVQFLLQTQEIKKAGIEKEPVKTEQSVKKNLWQKIIDLFR